MRRGSIWVDYSPPTLVHTCLRSCIDNTEAFRRNLMLDLFIPFQLSEELLDILSDWKYRAGRDRLVQLLTEFSLKLPIRTVALNSGPVPTHLIQANKLKKLDLRNIAALTKSAWDSIISTNESLESLTLVEITKDVADNYISSSTFFLPNIKYLSLKGNYSMNVSQLRVPRCSTLVLERVVYSERICVSYPNLTSLTLHGEHINVQLLCDVAHLKQLKFLDISFSFSDVIEDPAKSLRHLIRQLPRLEALDISGTSLVTTRTNRNQPEVPCDIDGLEDRAGYPLKFLGVYSMEDDISYTNIPALRVAAGDTEERLLTAGEVYLERVDVMLSILKRLLSLTRTNEVKDMRRAMDLVVQAMEVHLWTEEQDEQALQLIGAACLYYLIRSLADNGEDTEVERMERGVKEEVLSLASCNIAVKKRLIQTLLNTMEKHKKISSLIRNCVMAIWQLKIPEDPALLYSEVITRFLEVIHIQTSPEDQYIQKTTILLINGLVCYAEGELKKVKGRDIILGMMNIIDCKLQDRVTDEVMETVWSVLWNITDETASHSMIFIENGGMELFLRCRDAFPESLDLLRNMMGLLGNIAEDRECRKFLMNSQFIQQFSELLDSDSDGIEVSYNAAGVISHLASDGPECWLVQDPDRQSVLNKMCGAIYRWPVDSARNINYRSLAPILGLLDSAHCPESQLWAAWAVANLSSYDLHKYARLIVEEGGEVKINNINLGYFREDLKDKMTELSTIIIQNTTSWKNQFGSVIISLHT